MRGRDAPSSGWPGGDLNGTGSSWPRSAQARGHACRLPACLQLLNHGHVCHFQLLLLLVLRRLARLAARARLAGAAAAAAGFEGQLRHSLLVEQRLDICRSGSGGRGGQGTDQAGLRAGARPANAATPPAAGEAEAHR